MPGKRGKGSVGANRKNIKNRKIQNNRFIMPKPDQMFAVITANRGGQFECKTADGTIYLCPNPPKRALKIQPNILIAIRDTGLSRGKSVAGAKKFGSLEISYKREEFNSLRNTHPEKVPWNPDTGDEQGESMFNNGDIESAVIGDDGEDFADALGAADSKSMPTTKVTDSGGENINESEFDLTDADINFF